MTIDLFAAEKGGKHTIAHDLNFAKPRYEAKHVITFKNPNANLVEILRKSGPIPDDANGARKKGGDADAKKKRKTAQVDMDKLADGLTRLQEDDLLSVIQMIHDNKSDETYTKNDIDRKTPSTISTPTPPPAVSLRSPSPAIGFRLLVKPLQPVLPCGPPRQHPLSVSSPYETMTADDDDLSDGEFHVDLYTLPDNLVRMLWEFVQGRT